MREPARLEELTEKECTIYIMHRDIIDCGRNLLISALRSVTFVMVGDARQKYKMPRIFWSRPFCGVQE